MTLEEAHQHQSFTSPAASSSPRWVHVVQGSLPVLKLTGSWKQSAQGARGALSLARENFFISVSEQHTLLLAGFH